MVDLEQIKQLRALGVKSIEIHRDGAHFVEFYPPAPSIPPLDYDTLVPPAPAEDNPPNEPPRSQYRPPPALAALLTKPSVS